MQAGLASIPTLWYSQMESEETGGESSMKWSTLGFRTAKGNAR